MRVHKSGKEEVDSTKVLRDLYIVRQHKTQKIDHIRQILPSVTHRLAETDLYHRYRQGSSMSHGMAYAQPNPKGWSTYLHHVT